MHIYILYSYLPPISKTIQIRRTRHAGVSWRSKDELSRDFRLWTSSHGRASVDRPTRAYLQQLCTDPGYNLENLLETTDDRDKW